MDIPSLLSFIGAFAVGSSLLLAGIAWLIKSLFDRWIGEYFDERSEEFKIRFSKLHQKRGEVIEGLYSRLIDFEQHMASLVNPMQFGGEEAQREEYKKVAQVGDDFQTYTLKNRIYFSTKVCEILDMINDKFKKVWIDFSVFVAQPQAQQIPERAQKWMEAWQTVKEDIPKLREQLEKEFREILGVK